MLYSQYLDFLEKYDFAVSGERVIITRHEPCITLGKNAQENEVLKIGELPVFRSGRGGGATYHDAGQLMLYPIIDLAARGLNITQYIQILQKWGIEALARFGVRAHLGVQPGLWVDGAKVAFIGLAVRRGIAMHGMSFNLRDCNLRGFEAIIACKSFEKIGKCDIGFEEMELALQEMNPFWCDADVV